jgi:hypothetical protein
MCDQKNGAATSKQASVAACRQLSAKKRGEKEKKRGEDWREVRAILVAGEFFFQFFFQLFVALFFFSAASCCGRISTVHLGGGGGVDVRVSWCALALQCCRIGVQHSVVPYRVMRCKAID